MKQVKISLKKKKGCEDLPTPKYATSGSSGMDLYADVEGEVVLSPGEIKLISAGIYLDIPEGYEAEIRPRSGLALKHGISLVNTPGTIDSDYRGEIKVILVNLSNEEFIICDGERIAQMVIAAHEKAEWVEADEIADTVRGAGGFGHTGTK